MKAFKNILYEFNFIKGNFLILLLGWLLVDFSREMAYTYYPLYVTALGGSATILGLIGAAATIAEAIVKLPGGTLADKYRRRRLIIVMTLLASFSYLFYAFAPSWHFILLGAILTSLCWIYTPSFDAITIESLPKDKRGTGYSLINLITNASTTPSPLIAGLLFTRYGVIGASRVAFGLVSLAFLAASVLRSRIVEETDKPEVTVKDLAASFSDAKTFGEGMGVWREVPRMLTVLLSVELLYMLPNVMFNTVLALFLVNDLGMSGVQLSYLATIVAGTVIVLAIPCGRAIDRLGRVKPLLFGYALTAVTLPILLINPSFLVIALAAPVIGLFNVIFFSSTQALWADLVPEDRRGRVMASKRFFELIPLAGGSILGGFIYDNISHSAPVYAYIVGSLLCFMVTWVFIKEPKHA